MKCFEFLWLPIFRKQCRCESCRRAMSYGSRLNRPLFLLQRIRDLPDEFVKFYDWRIRLGCLEIRKRSPGFVC